MIVSGAMTSPNKRKPDLLQSASTSSETAASEQEDEPAVATDVPVSGDVPVTQIEQAVTPPPVKRRQIVTPKRTTPKSATANPSASAGSVESTTVKPEPATSSTPPPQPKPPGIRRAPVQRSASTKSLVASPYPSPQQTQPAPPSIQQTPGTASVNYELKWRKCNDSQLKCQSELKSVQERLQKITDEFNKANADFATRRSEFDRSKQELENTVTSLQVRLKATENDALKQIDELKMKRVQTGMEASEAKLNDERSKAALLVAQQNLASLEQQLTDARNIATAINNKSFVLDILSQNFDNIWDKQLAAAEVPQTNLVSLLDLRESMATVVFKGGADAAKQAAAQIIQNLARKSKPGAVAEPDRSHLASELEELKDRLAKSQVQTTKAQMDCKDVRAQLAIEQQEVQRLRLERDNVQAEADLATAANNTVKNEQIAVLEKQIQTALERETSLLKKYEESTAAIQKAAGAPDLSELRMENIRLRARVNALENPDINVGARQSAVASAQEKQRRPRASEFQAALSAAGSIGENRSVSMSDDPTSRQTRDGKNEKDGKESRSQRPVAAAGGSSGGPAVVVASEPIAVVEADVDDDCRMILKELEFMLTWMSQKMNEYSTLIQTPIAKAKPNASADAKVTPPPERDFMKKVDDHLDIVTGFVIGSVKFATSVSRTLNRVDSAGMQATLGTLREYRNAMQLNTIPPWTPDRSQYHPELSWDTMLTNLDKWKRTAAFAYWAERKALETIDVLVQSGNNYWQSVETAVERAIGANHTKEFVILQTSIGQPRESYVAYLNQAAAFVAKWKEVTFLLGIRQTPVAVGAVPAESAAMAIDAKQPSIADVKPTVDSKDLTDFAGSVADKFAGLSLKLDAACAKTTKEITESRLELAQAKASMASSEFLRKQMAAEMELLSVAYKDLYSQFQASPALSGKPGNVSSTGRPIVAGVVGAGGGSAGQGAIVGPAVPATTQAFIDKYGEVTRKLVELQRDRVTLMGDSKEDTSSIKSAEKLGDLLRDLRTKYEVKIAEQDLRLRVEGTRVKDIEQKLKDALIKRTELKDEQERSAAYEALLLNQVSGVVTMDDLRRILNDELGKGPSPVLKSVLEDMLGLAKALKSQEAFISSNKVNVVLFNIYKDKEKLIADTQKLVKASDTKLATALKRIDDFFLEAQRLEQAEFTAIGGAWTNRIRDFVFRRYGIGQYIASEDEKDKIFTHLLTDQLTRLPNPKRSYGSALGVIPASATATPFGSVVGGDTKGAPSPLPANVGERSTNDDKRFMSVNPTANVSMLRTISGAEAAVIAEAITKLMKERVSAWTERTSSSEDYRLVIGQGLEIPKVWQLEPDLVVQMSAKMQELIGPNPIDMRAIAERTSTIVEFLSLSSASLGKELLGISDLTTLRQRMQRDRKSMADAQELPDLMKLSDSDVDVIRTLQSQKNRAMDETKTAAEEARSFRAQRDDCRKETAKAILRARNFTKFATDWLSKQQSVDVLTRFGYSEKVMNFELDEYKALTSFLEGLPARLKAKEKELEDCEKDAKRASKSMVAAGRVGGGNDRFSYLNEVFSEASGRHLHSIGARPSSPIDVFRIFMMLAVGQIGLNLNRAINADFVDVLDAYVNGTFEQKDIEALVYKSTADKSAASLLATPLRSDLKSAPEASTTTESALLRGMTLVEDTDSEKNILALKSKSERLIEALDRMNDANTFERALPTLLRPAAFAAFKFSLAIIKSIPAFYGASMVAMMHSETVQLSFATMVAEHMRKSLIDSPVRAPITGLKDERINLIIDHETAVRHLQTVRRLAQPYNPYDGNVPEWLFEYWSDR